MAYGVRIRTSEGKITIDTSDRVTRHVYTSAQTASSGNSGALSQLTGKLSGDFCVPVNCGSTQTAHKVTRSGTTLTWTTYSNAQSGITPATCVIFSFIYT